MEIRNANTGRIYGKWPLQETGEFAIEFIHSVHQSPVRETFVVEGGMIRPEVVRFSSFGAGMRSDIEEGQKLSRDGEYLLITGFGYSSRELNYITGTHVLFINGEKIILSDLCGKNAHITICLSGGNNR